VRGAGSAGFLNRCLTNDLGKIRPGQAQYTLLCFEDGGVLDDLIVYLRSEDDLLLVPNAANCAAVVDALTAAAPPGVTVSNQHTAFAVIAVQGAASDEVVAGAGFPTGHDYMSFVDVHRDGGNLIICRTGYTGERGYEVVVPVATALQTWDALVGAGKRHRLQPAGLGARDTLRLEMGYPLHGQDISATITPVQARLGWAIGWNKPHFFGDAALRGEKSAGPGRLLRGLRAAGRGIPRRSMVVRNADGGRIGEVTSGTFSPTLKTGIALALLATDVTVDDVVHVDIRGRLEPFVVAKPPFVTPGVREP